MTITIREAVYLLTYIITIISMFMVFRNHLYNISKQVKLINDIIFGDKGALNIVDARTLKTNMDPVWDRIRQDEAAMNMILQEIKDLNRKVMATMFKLNINMPEMMRLSKPENGSDED